MANVGQCGCWLRASCLASPCGNFRGVCRLKPTTTCLKWARGSIPLAPCRQRSRIVLRKRPERRERPTFKIRPTHLASASVVRKLSCDAETFRTTFFPHKIHLCPPKKPTDLAGSHQTVSIRLNEDNR